ncbi:hypothetical protein B0G77_0326 [Paraburkholderia sp. BL10I2N1]|nr:hypothetical protein B0G77_0326 [Paraburkholderia sp. BL10I2N1]
MPCDACERMLQSATPAPHPQLLKSHCVTRLRPLGRRPIEVCKYRCRQCDVQWMLETDMSNADEHEWICLYNSSSILEPGSVAALTSRTETESPAVTRVNSAHAVGPEWSYRMLIQLGSLPFV